MLLKTKAPVKFKPFSYSCCPSHVKITYATFEWLQFLYVTIDHTSRDVRLWIWLQPLRLWKETRGLVCKDVVCCVGGRRKWNTNFGFINWIDKVNWPPQRDWRLTFRALALRQSKGFRAKDCFFGKKAYYTLLLYGTVYHVVGGGYRFDFLDEIFFVVVFASSYLQSKIGTFFDVKRCGSVRIKTFLSKLMDSTFSVLLLNRKTPALPFMSHVTRKWPRPT